MYETLNLAFFHILFSVAKAYTVGAIFTDVKGIVVNMEFFTPEFQDQNKPLLQNDVSMKAFCTRGIGSSNCYMF